MDPIYAAVEHQRLYNKIPSFQCKSGCQDCCGPVPFSKWEWDRIANKRTPTDEQKKSLTCPYAVGGKCEIYDKRPLICRMFGAVDDPLLTCPHGCGPKKKLTKEQGAEIRAEYIRLMKKCKEKEAKSK